MNSAQRMAHISKLLEQHGNVEVNHLCQLFGVTGKTIRLDLAKMEKMGLVDRVHGGAVRKQTGNGLFQIKTRRHRNLELKEQIARRALEHIKDNDIVIVDGGSTTLQLANLLGEKRVTVITNDLLIAGVIMVKDNVSLYVSGGKLSEHHREEVFTLSGREAERTISKYNVNKLFLAVTALDYNQGAMVFSEDEAEMKKAMIKSSEQVICVADSTKFHKQAFVPFADLTDIDIIITDNQISEKDIEQLQQLGITVEIAES